MSEKVLLVVHQEHSDPGRVGQKLRKLGYETDIRRLACGDPLPATMDEHAGAVIFGGPMSANDDIIPFIRSELDWIPMAIASGKPYLGICLGAQLLARAMGAKVGPHPDGYHEIGYYRLRPTPDGASLFSEDFHVYEWHGEGFALPTGAVRLAETDHFPNQAFRVGERAFGFQFHPEVNETIMRRWTTKAAHRMVLPGAQCRERHFLGLAAHDGRIDRWVEDFLARWLNPEKVAIAAE